jgi:TetR/AcrR family transcriptional regulator
VTESAETGPNRRLPADERRQQLIDTAARLFADRGFSGTTTREIARAAGVTEAVIFRYFAHKDDLYAAILDWKSAAECTSGWVDELRAAAAHQDDEAVVRVVVRRLIEFQRRDPAFLKLMLHSALESHGLAAEYRRRHFAPLQQFLREYIEAGQRAGRFVAGDPRVLVRALFAVPMHHNLVEVVAIDPDNRLDTPETIDIYTSFIVRALRAPHSGSQE